jgi:hypothetical protein
LSSNDQHAHFVAHLSHSSHSRVFLFSLLIYLIPLCFQHFQKIISLNICGMQNYIMLTPKNTSFFMHILFQVFETIITVFCLQFEVENKLN